MIKESTVADVFMGASWSDMSVVLKQHPDVFSPDFITEELFRHVEISVGSRVFGYSIPCTAIIPMADMLNHSDLDVQYEVFNKRLHLLDEKAGSYYTRSKFHFDYSFIYTPEELDKIKEDERHLLNVKGRSNMVNFKANQKRYTNTDTFADQMKLGIRLWDIPCIKRHYTQDNDDSSEEESDEEEKKSSVEDSQPSLVKEIIKQAELIGKGPKKFKHL